MIDTFNQHKKHTIPSRQSNDTILTKSDDLLLNIIGDI